MQNALLLAQEETQKKGISTEQWLAIGVGVAVLVIPFILGSFLAKGMKMPSYSTRFGFVLLAVIASVSVLLNKVPDKGVDLSGGTILVYEIDSSKVLDGKQIKAENFVKPLTDRINPSGTQEIVIRPYGDRQLEIIIPEVDQREVDEIKKVIEETGILRFAIVANQADHQRVIDNAITMADDDNLGVRLRSNVGTPKDPIYGIWVEVGRESQTANELRPLRVDVQDATIRDSRTGRIVTLPNEYRGENSVTKVAQWRDREELAPLEILMIINPRYDILGGDLSHAARTFDETGNPSIAFTLNDKGSGRFAALTTANLPDGTRKKLLGIVMDDTLLSAPTINTTISKEGRITGSFTREEVDSLVQVLQAGQLPAALTSEPIAENQIDATLGLDTINKGLYSIGVSIGLVLLFILVYYRFAGFIACLALVLNLGMILATMVLINQPLTLPGLAGLVLTVGMSVDANVLIFERIREEIGKGAKDRMAIRNGFAKATVTIVDANLTTLITAFVLYAIGTDQIRGFAVTLILGILYSMFTAIYMSRTLFDVAERRGFLSLSMSDSVNALRAGLAGGGQFDFIGKGKMALACSAVLIVVGISALWVRGRDILDIDFAGGSSVQFRVADATDTGVIREVVGSSLKEQEVDGKTIQYTVNGVTMEGAPDGTVFKVDSSMDKVESLKKALELGFAADTSIDLVSYEISVKPGANDSSMLPRFGAAMLAIAQDEDAAPADADTAEPVDVSDVADTVATAETSTDDEPAADDTPSIGELTYINRTISLGIQDSEDESKMNARTLGSKLIEAAEAVDIKLTERVIQLMPIGDGADSWNPESDLTFSDWTIGLPLDDDGTDKVVGQLVETLSSEPVWMSSSSVGSRVAGDMVGRAFGALFASLLCIIGYIWFRFQRVIYGFAAVAALLHDILITLGAIAISFWAANAFGFLLIEEFKISLTVVAALLTIIGYSLNDTIVVFDRIRETKGKSPRLTGEMINKSINQTLSRTLLTSITTLIVVVLLYAFGGDGIHAFAFALVIGVLVGTYSSVFVASPILLWLVERNEKSAA